MFAVLLAAPTFAQDIDSNLVGHWRLDETSGTTAADSSSSGNDGTMSGLNAATDSVDGQVGTALDFGGNDYINIGTSTIDGSTEASVCLWYFYEGPNPLPEQKYFISKYQPGFHGWLFTMTAGTESINFQPGTNTGGSSLSSSANSVNYNEWTHVCAVFKAGEYIRLYIDGVLDTERTTSIASSISSSGPNLRIGAHQFGGNRFNGRMDDVRLYDRALSDEDVFALAKTFFGPMTCNAAYEAVMIFNNDRKVMQYCNGTDWIDMGSAGPKLNSQQLIGHWPLDETSGTTAEDISTNENNGTMQNGMDATTATVAGQIGTGLYFSQPAEHWIEMPNEALYDMGSNDFTVSAWANFTSGGAATGTIIAKGIIGACCLADGYPGYQLLKQGNNIQFRLEDTAAGINMVSTPGIAVGPYEDSWHHYAGVRQGNNITLYIDGVPMSSAELSGAFDTDNSWPLTIGAWRWGASSRGGELEGAVDDARIYTRALSSDEIQNLYASKSSTGCTLPDGKAGEVGYNFTDGVMQYCNGHAWVNMGPKIEDGGVADITYTAPTSNLVGHWPLDDTNTTALDTAGSNNGTMLGGLDGATDSTTGQDGNAIAFDGTSDYIDIGDVELSNTDITVSAWVNYQSLNAGNDDPIITKYSSSGERAYALKGNGTNFSFSVSDDGTSGAGNQVLAASSSAPSTGQWYHVAGTFEASTGTASIYVDGTLAGTATDAGVTGIYDATRSLRIGTWESAGDDYTNGTIDDARIYNRVLSPDEVYSLYRSTGGTNDGLAVHLKFDESNGTTAADSTVNGLDGSLDNGLDAATDSVAGVSGRALDFDGSDDRVSIPANALHNDSNTFTYAGWFYPTSTTQNRRFFENGVTVLNQWSNGQITIAVGRWSGGYAQWETPTGTITPDAWQHIAVTYDYSSTANDPVIYVNGSAVSLNETTAPSGSVTNTANYTIYVGNRADSARPWAGRIDDFRMYNRVLNAEEVALLYANTGGGSIPVTGCPNIGDLCDDGTLYAGDLDYGSGAEKLFVATTNQSTSLTWHATGSNDGISNDSLTDGKINHANLNEALTNYPAIEICENLNAAGHSDWYLPARDELQQLYTNQVAINANATENFNPSGYWTSSEWTAGVTNLAWQVSFASGTAGNETKTNSRYVRCIRRGNAVVGGTCTNPPGVPGEMIYNDDNNVMQYCVDSDTVPPNGWVQTR